MMTVRALLGMATAVALAGCSDGGSKAGKLTTAVPSGIAWVSVPTEATVTPSGPPFEGKGGPADPTSRSLRLPAGVSLDAAIRWFSTSLPVGRSEEGWAWCRRQSVMGEGDLTWGWYRTGDPLADSLLVTVGQQKGDPAYVSVLIVPDDNPRICDTPR